MSDRRFAQIYLKDFTAFTKLTVDLSPGINVFIGKNGTGKTHVLKTLYAASAAARTDVNYAEKLTRVFRPTGDSIGRLVHRCRGNARAVIRVRTENHMLQCSFSKNTRMSKRATVVGDGAWSQLPLRAAYVPVKEMLANAPGFLAMYRERVVHFEEVYADIIERAYLPVLRGRMSAERQSLMSALEQSMAGHVRVVGEEFILSGAEGNLEFTLVAEGIRKQALLWLLIQNGTLTDGSVLFWDEPEANMNPAAVGDVAQILLELQRLGVQVFVASHDYVLLRELDVRSIPGDDVTFHAMFRGPSGDIECETTRELDDINNNAITETFVDLFRRDVLRHAVGR